MEPVPIVRDGERRIVEKSLALANARLNIIYIIWLRGICLKIITANVALNSTILLHRSHIYNIIRYFTVIARIPAKAVFAL